MTDRKQQLKEEITALETEKKSITTESFAIKLKAKTVERKIKLLLEELQELEKIG